MPFFITIIIFHSVACVPNSLDSNIILLTTYCEDNIHTLCLDVAIFCCVLTPGALRDSSTESIDTIGMPHGPSSHGLSSHGPEVSEEFIVPTQKSQQGNML